METVEASLIIELNVTCPHCDEYFDLMEIENGRLNEEGALMDQACPAGCWTDKHDQYEETVQCPECALDVVIKGIVW